MGASTSGDAKRDVFMDASVRMEKMKLKPDVFEPGQKVWFYYPWRVKGRAPILPNYWEEP